MHDVNSLGLKSGNFVGGESGLAESGGEGVAAADELATAEGFEGVAGDGGGVGGGAAHKEGGEDGLCFGCLAGEEGLGGGGIAGVEGGGDTFLQEGVAGSAGQDGSILRGEPLSGLSTDEGSVEEEADDGVGLFGGGAFGDSASYPLTAKLAVDTENPVFIPFAMPRIAAPPSTAPIN